ncbi:MAG: hypothetical protein C4523_13895 [Myxococcales bacterium]|nr:MAG: hypothetical protein C4523_13895 [Myxococcales bacterium]
MSKMFLALVLSLLTLVGFGCESSSLTIEGASPDEDSIDQKSDSEDASDDDAEDDASEGGLPELDGDIEKPDGDPAEIEPGDPDPEDGDADISDSESDETADDDGPDDPEGEMPEADADIQDIEPEPATACEQQGGVCGAGTCPNGMREAETPQGCAGICCVNEDQLPCIENGGYCTMVRWEQPQTYPCDATHHPSPASDGCNLFTEWCCAATDSSCVGEGRMGSLVDESPDNDHCCDGLTNISTSNPPMSGGCEPAEEGIFLCTHCGDGRCDLYESRCNCNTDCASAGHCADNGGNCPATICRNRDSLFPWVDTECVEMKYDCDPSSHYCVGRELTYMNQQCNLNTGRCQEP